MALSSPGVQVSIIDESQYAPPAPASIPLILIATAQNKANGAGTGVATGTLKANANKLYSISSQRDLTALFGNPFFYKTTNGTPIQGYELNEYGLQAAYSVLGLTNRCYVLRADIDLASLVGRTSRPTGEPTDGTYWLDTTNSTWGVYEFNQSTGNFTNKIPIVITNLDDLEDTTGQPKSSVGNIGDYAVVYVTDNNGFNVAAEPDTYSTYWYKILNNQWVPLGSVMDTGGADWRTNWPTVQGANAVISPDTLTAGSQFSLQGVTITVPVAPNNTVSGVAGAINTAQIPFVSAAAVNGRLEIYANSTVQNVEVGTVGPSIVLSELGIDDGTYYAPSVVFGSNAQQPRWRITDAEPHPTGSVWVKTTSANLGTKPVIKRWSSATASWSTQTVNVATSDWAMNALLDTTGGKNIPAGALYVQYGSDTSTNVAPLQYFRRSAVGASIFTGSVPNPDISANGFFTVQVSLPGSSNLSGEYTVTMPSSPSTQTAADFVTAWTAANIPYTVASVSSSGYVVISHTLGGVIIIDETGSPSSVMAEIGFDVTSTPGVKWGPYATQTLTNQAASGGAGSAATFNISTNGFIPSFTVNVSGTGYAVGNLITVAGYTLKVTSIGSTGNITGVAWYDGFATPVYTLQFSNWEPLIFIPNPISPSRYPENETNWYYSVVNQADIMTNVNGEWKGYRNVCYASNGLPQFSGTPVTDPNGPLFSNTAPAAQSDGTSLEYGDLWIDTSDLENYPIISRWQSVNGVDSWVQIDNTDQQTENGILFADARWDTDGTTDPVEDPIPTIKSLLTSDYLDLDAPNAAAYPQGTLLFNTRRSGYNVKQFRLNYFNGNSFPDAVLPDQTSTWVTVSGNMSNGAPYMGRKAQRAMVVQALKASINSNTQILDDDTFFNLIAAPNYCELQPDMITLNNNRNNTAYIIGDTPMRLADNATDILNWSANTARASSTGEDGLVTRNTYMGIYYPSGLTTDLTGASVAVPPSHMILRTMLYNDNVAYPWFAPAGQRRGIIDNATNIGYVSSETGEFVISKNRQQLRDVEYTNFINPISFFTNVGLLNYGNKNSFNSQSSLDRTNVARLVAYLRWQLQLSLRPFIFEPNDTITRAEAKGVVQTLLMDILSKRGIYDYIVVCDETNNTPARIDANELWIDVAIEPAKAAEFIYVPVRLLNTGEIRGV